ncbi:hypothetical protein D3C75_1241120 [compost metagenome]
MASATAIALRLSLNESGAITTFFSVFISIPYPARLNTPNINAETAAMVKPIRVSYGSNFSR